MKKKHISHKSQTNWERVDKLQDNDIDFSDNPEVTPEMFAKAIVRKGLKPVVRKNQVTLRERGQKGVKSLFDLIITSIIEKKAQDQTLGSKLIWVLFLNKHGNN